jgi:hypothetical protein
MTYLGSVPPQCNGAEHAEGPVRRLVYTARMVRQLPADAKAAREAARRLAEMVRRRSVPVDVRAADDVKRVGDWRTVLAGHGA